MENTPPPQSLRLPPRLLLFFLFFLFYSTRATGELPSEVQEKSRVLFLPGQNFNVSFFHYSGYVTVDKESGRALFYWFFEAAEDPVSKPLVLWLNGGPGCSSIAYGLAEELGPFHVTADGKGLYFNEYSWNQEANILFLDSPVGVGYSYSNNSEDVLNNGDARTAKDSLVFLKKWFKLYPQYKGRNFHLTGESYAGHYVPQLAQEIVRHHKLTGDTSINLKGYMVGNALTDDFNDHYGVFQFMWVAGLISDETYNALNVLCDYQSFVHDSSECEKILDLASKEMGNIDPYSIFTPSCTSSASFSRNKLLKRMRMGKMSEKYDPCTEKHSTVYFNLPEVQKALHVNPAVAPTKWETCSDTVNENWKDSAVSILPIYKELIDYGLRIWVFSGDTDAVIPLTSTRYNVDALNLTTVTPWHAWYDDGQVGGWTQVYEGLTLVTVRGAGHEVPLHRPKLALVLFKQFLSGSPMPTISEHESS
ncbi:cathepsin A (carboxypeptidase C) [Apostasia shenzhenica]|uniref:Carboxypeptidase n=1 Tax=Apostasia shenzhenica TaxID=1088818 RepID=A0A2I0A0Z1_9ASPA|nr:cathepsin A (carboxypeptidase C) [Apostasia shenzhenica]